MKRDIRNLFKEEEETGRTLPKAHRQEFYDKLKASRRERRTQINQSYIVRIAAIVILLFALTFVLVKSTEKVSQTIVEESSIESQIEAIEQEYLASIDQEWNNFINLEPFALYTINRFLFRTFGRQSCTIS